MKQISIFLTISLMIVSVIIGVGFGYYLTPQYKNTMYQKSMGLGVVDRSLDKRYLEGMIMHHLMAIDLADAASQKSQRPEIKTLAEEIKTNEPKLIEELYKWRAEWYEDKSRVKAPEKINLGNTDDTFDLRFLNALIAHHDEGLIMTKEVRSKSSRAEVLNNADAVENFLNTTKKQLVSWRLEWYQVGGEE